MYLGEILMFVIIASVNDCDSQHLQWCVHDCLLVTGGAFALVWTSQSSMSEIYQVSKVTYQEQVVQHGTQHGSLHDRNETVPEGKESDS